MNENTELLNYIYQNSQMGITSIEKLKEIIEDDKATNHMHTQILEYRNINNEAKRMLDEYNVEPKSISTIEKWMSDMSIRMNTMMDKSTSHVAEMMMQGSNMGIIDATKNLKKYPNANNEVKRLGEKLLSTEQANLDQWKQML